MSIIVLYHSADYDGILSREAILLAASVLHNSDPVQKVGWDYGKPLPTVDDDNRPVYWSRAKLIYIVDLSCPVLMDDPDFQSRIVWIDHHHSAIEKWDKGERRFEGFRINGVAACRLCLQYMMHQLEIFFFGSPARPLPTFDDFHNHAVIEPPIFRLVGAYDVMDRRDPDAELCNYGLDILTPQELVALVKANMSDPLVQKHPMLDRAIECGRIIQKYLAKLNGEIASQRGHTIHWHGLNFLVINGVKGSLAFEKSAKPEHDAFMAWYYDGSTCRVSMYSIEGEDHDLSAIANLYGGGGGHKKACGFKVSLPEMQAILHHEKV